MGQINIVVASGNLSLMRNLCLEDIVCKGFLTAHGSKGTGYQGVYY